MLANFFLKNNHCKLKFTVCIFVLFSFQVFFCQNYSIFENITESDGLPSNYVFNTCEDQNHILWVGTDKGLVAYQDGKWISLDADNGMPGNYINNSIFDGKNGLLLSISDKGLFYFDTNLRKILVKYNEINGKRISSLKQANKNTNYIIIRLFNPIDKQEGFWAFDKNNIKKLLKLSTDNKNLFLYKNGKKEIIADIKTIEQTETIEYDNFSLKIQNNKILRYLNGKIYDTLTERQGLGNAKITHILKRKKLNIIISTIGNGIFILRYNNPKVSFINKNTNVRKISTANNKIYILSDGFIYIINDKKIESKIFVRNDTMSFLVDGEDLYIGSFSGLHFYKIKNGKLFLKKEIQLKIGISNIYKKQNKIIFTTYGNGVYILEKNILKRINIKPFNNIENFYKINSGYALLSYESGVSITNENFGFVKHFDKKNGLESNFATTIFSDNDTLYIGTKKAVSVFYKNILLTKYNHTNGFRGEITRSIFKDNKNTLWILTDKYLLRKTKNVLEPIGSLRLTDNAEDLILKGNYSPENNMLVIANKNKFSKIRVDKIVSNNYVAATSLEKITENGKQVNSEKKILFPDHNKNIYLIFKSVDQYIVSKNKLYYKINNDMWKPFRQPRVLVFPHLDQGEYTLQVKTVNEDGFEKLMQKPIKFKVQGPFYIRWWFILLSVSFVSIFLYNYIDELNKRKYIRKLGELRIKHQLENERKRISRDLHDNIGAYITSLISKIDLLKSKINPSPLQNNYNCDDVRLDAEHILALLRQTIWVLDNKDTNLIALYDNFKSYALKFLQTENIKIIFEENIENNRVLNTTTGSGIFRIMQEALQNIHKHANASVVEINVISNKKIIILIKDNGQGFSQETSKQGYGLQNMRERAKELGFKFNIYSDSKGTSLELYEI